MSCNDSAKAFHITKTVRLFYLLFFDYSISYRMLMHCKEKQVQAVIVVFQDGSKEVITSSQDGHVSFGHISFGPLSHSDETVLPSLSIGTQVVIVGGQKHPLKETVTF